MSDNIYKSIIFDKSIKYLKIKINNIIEFRKIIMYNNNIKFKGVYINDKIYSYEFGYGYTYGDIWGYN